MDNSETLSAIERSMIGSLRDRGFAVCIFTPEELGEAPADDVEGMMWWHGWDAIGCLSDDVKAE